MMVDTLTQPNTTQTTAEKPWLNFGCGKNIYRGEEGDKAFHQFLIPDEVFKIGRKWINADIVPNEGVDELVSMSHYPFPWPDNHFGGVVLSHVVEHLPHGIAIGAITDPTHRRQISEHTFTHCLTPQEEGATFYYVQDCNWQLIGAPGFHVNDPFVHLIGHPELFQEALMTRINVAHSIYGALRAIK